MKKTLLFGFLFLLLFNKPDAAAQSSVTVFDGILFYDGYAGVVNYPTPEGIIRHRNDLYAKMLTADELASFGNTLTINVTIGAACDNYDRIGDVNLAFVPKGSVTYDPNAVQRIELARFITPFMNKNVSPTEVPYTFTVDNVAKIFKDQALLAAYDIWAELQVFGVPYAAQTQIAGCAGQIDTFYGTLEFVSADSNPVSEGQNYLLPLNFQNYLNDYQEGASDAIGDTMRTITFDLPTAVNNASFYLITSNHGANSGGEEYIRRYHYIYLDDTLLLTYRPGGVSCEPYRMYNTQANGIYGATPQTPAQWASFSNWCPGQVIPIREIPLGNLAAGSHSFVIHVPQAVFAGNQGYIPVSLYLQGTAASLGVDEANLLSYSLSPNPTSGIVDIMSSSEVMQMVVTNMLGQHIKSAAGRRIDLTDVPNGIYMVRIEFQNQKFITQKVIKQ
jgi:hypothetical protein